MPKVARNDAKQPLQEAAMDVDIEKGQEGPAAAGDLPQKPEFAALQGGGSGEKIEFRRVRSCSPL